MMMAFLDELENLLYGTSNDTDQENLEAFFNDSKNISINGQLLDEGDILGWSQILLIFAYGILIAISLFGNILVCHVIFIHRRMWTVTNFFIANLAVADLLVTCINVPFNIARNLLDEWPFGSVMCHLLNFSLMVSVYVSTFTLLGIALDRHQVLLYPLHPRMSRPVGISVLGFIWLLSICLSLPFGMYNKVQKVDFLLKKLDRCTTSFPYPSERWEKYLTVGTLLLQYVIPLTVIGVTYGRIVRKLWVRTHVGAVTQNQQASQQKAKRKSIKLLICVVVIFAICWMPLNLYQVLADFHPNVEVFHYNSTTFFICHWIAISSTCYNPFVYCWLNETFRAEVKARFKCCLPRPKRVHPGTDINGTLYRSDRAYQRRQSKSSNGLNRTSISKVCDKYKVDIDISTKEQSEFLTETAVNPSSDISRSATDISGSTGSLKTVTESPELVFFSERGESVEYIPNGIVTHKL
ncbi:G-protein coupled receptor 83-like [Mercenaria mercenaria]|uniref:G-protein coupled receptor 83-like n=1 Tax=Mercenaria mercenaria TaxID=6596 RepID=UPI00234F05DB|nr:G-protein coupled receptor 83-like [Mercenaria mercenaria]XP_053407118.1 G-protein coupled receptor 83-like [Mercenaria mercenaria]XP_053407119.1 G-protein coupled receptor 83-like [Mercenaria mercenaria]XP_053407120.1 G-protein coupled receptor 83-like [Mercenaria mercenaria]XP_053407121.1 G-protein coupled receptor 83-like [Mercenaria mercenaria]